MGFPVLNKSCWTCSLRTGGMITGAVNIIFGLYYMAAGTILFMLDYPEDVDVKIDLVAVGPVQVIMGALLLLTGVALIFGAVVERSKVMIPCMAVIITSILLNIITTSLAVVELFNQKESASAILAIVIMILFIVVETYFLLVIYSLYRELKEDEEGSEPD